MNLIFHDIRLHGRIIAATLKIFFHEYFGEFLFVGKFIYDFDISDLKELLIVRISRNILIEKVLNIQEHKVFAVCALSLTNE
jgi:hypothetical protein